MKALLIRKVHEKKSTSCSLSLRERVGVRGYNTQVILCMLLSLLMFVPIESASAMNHGGMVMNEKGMIMNANSDKLPATARKFRKMWI